METQVFLNPEFCFSLYFAQLLLEVSLHLHLPFNKRGRPPTDFLVPIRIFMQQMLDQRARAAEITESSAFGPMEHVSAMRPEAFCI